MRKRIGSLLFVMVLLTSILSASYVSALTAGSAQAEPRYTGISSLSSTLTVSSSGGAKCNGSVIVRSGYTADVTVELKQDGVTIKTWTASGSGSVSAGSTYYVMSGHDYVVTTTAKVKDTNGKVIESPSKDSPKSSY